LKALGGGEPIHRLAAPQLASERRRGRPRQSLQRALIFQIVEFRFQTINLKSAL
jgi:hypothetical protein